MKKRERKIKNWRKKKTRERKGDCTPTLATWKT